MGTTKLYTVGAGPYFFKIAVLWSLILAILGGAVHFFQLSPLPLEQIGLVITAVVIFMSFLSVFILRPCVIVDKQLRTLTARGVSLPGNNSQLPFDQVKEVVVLAHRHRKGPRFTVGIEGVATFYISKDYLTARKFAEHLSFAIQKQLNDSAVGASQIRKPEELSWSFAQRLKRNNTFCERGMNPAPELIKERYESSTPVLEIPGTANAQTLIRLLPFYFVIAIASLFFLKVNIGMIYPITFVTIAVMFYAITQMREELYFEKNHLVIRTKIKSLSFKRSYKIEEIEEFFMTDSNQSPTYWSSGARIIFLLKNFTRIVNFIKAEARKKNLGQPSGTPKFVRKGNCHFLILVGDSFIKPIAYLENREQVDFVYNFLLYQFQQSSYSLSPLQGEAL